MRSLRIEVPMLPPFSVSPNARVSWTAEWQGKKTYGAAVFYCAIDARNRSDDFTPYEVARIDIELIFPMERTRDADNAVASLKSGLDGIVRAGIIKGDDHKHLHWGHVNITVDRERAPMTVITLTEEAKG